MSALSNHDECWGKRHKNTAIIDFYLCTATVNIYVIMLLVLEFYCQLKKFWPKILGIKGKERSSTANCVATVSLAHVTLCRWKRCNLAQCTCPGT